MTLGIPPGGNTTMALIIKFQNHARASAGVPSKKSSAVTAPFVSAAIRAATSRDGQPLPSHSDVTHPPETPIRRAKSPRLMPRSSRYSDSLMTETFSPAKISAQLKILALTHGQSTGHARKFSMAKRQRKQEDTVQTRFKQPPFKPTFIKQWRKKRGYSQGQLAELIGTSTATISQIETGKTGYSQAHLEAMAEALSCDPVDLLIRNPADPEGLWSLWDQAAPGQRKQILGIIKGLLASEAA